MKYLLSFVVLFSTSLFAMQTVNLTGVVVDDETNEPLAAANIFITETNTGTTTDANGQFEINLPPGKYIVSASHIGYQPLKKVINLKSGTRELQFRLKSQIIQGQEVMIEVSRAKERETPVVFTDITHKEIANQYSVQDIPLLISEVPGVYAYSDAGNGVGYSYLKIRGFDQKRVSVMINGIPLNDPEDHQVYWVDMPDFASSVQDIQIQRGVGSSLYGRSSFGGAINVITSETNIPRTIGVQAGYGSYDTEKYSFNFNSGLIDNKYAFSARFSKITTNGYRDNSAVDLWSYFLSAAHYGLKSTMKINVYGGPELTHAAWEASPESELKKNHNHNPYTYPNSVDNFNQPHYELLHTYKISPILKLSNTLFYIHGRGYYEIFKSDRDLIDYGYSNFYLTDSTLVTSTDLVRQKWVEKDQIGFISRLDFEHTNGVFTFGGDFYKYWSDHWGKVLWAARLPENSDPDHIYYNYLGEKIMGSLFLHELYRITPQLTLMGDINIQFQKYDFIQKEQGNFVGANRHGFKVDYSFLNPKLGVNYNISTTFNMFASISMSHREPSSDDLYDTWQGPDDLGVAPLFAKSDTIRSNSGEIEHIEWEDPLTEAERLIDYEFGFGYLTDHIQVKLNFYWMDFRNEIVPYSQVDKDGFPIKGNADNTVHRGVESSVSLQLTNDLKFSGSFALSQNYFSEFLQYEARYNDDWEFIGSSTTDFSGNSIAGFPSVLANARLSYRIGSVDTYLQIQHNGKQYLDNTEQDTRSLNAFTLVNWKIGYEVRDVPGFQTVRFNFWINNLLDERYETAGYYDSWAGENYLWPGANRNYFLNIELNL